MQLFLVLLSEYKVTGDIKQIYKQCHSLYPNTCSFKAVTEVLTIYSNRKWRVLHLRIVYIPSLHSKAT